MSGSSLLESGNEYGPELSWDDGERRFCPLRRRDADGALQEYLAVLPAAEHPTQGCVSRLGNEYELREYIDGAWALRPMEFVRERGRTVLVLEYHGGVPLDRLSVPPMDIGRFLRLAVALSRGLAGVHAGGLVHKDIKPANIIVDDT